MKKGNYIKELEDMINFMENYIALMMEMVTNHLQKEQQEDLERLILAIEYKHLLEMKKTIEEIDKQQE